MRKHESTTRLEIAPVKGKRVQATYFSIGTVVTLLGNVPFFLTEPKSTLPGLIITQIQRKYNERQIKQNPQIESAFLDDLDEDSFKKRVSLKNNVINKVSEIQEIEKVRGFKKYRVNYFLNLEAILDKLVDIKIDEPSPRQKQIIKLLGLCPNKCGTFYHTDRAVVEEFANCVANSTGESISLHTIESFSKAIAQIVKDNPFVKDVLKNNNLEKLYS